MVAIIVTCPFFLAIIFPVLLTVAIDLSLDFQVYNALLLKDTVYISPTASVNFVFSYRVWLVVPIEGSTKRQTLS